MIDRALHNQLMAKWPGRIYADPKRITPRLTHLEGLLPLLKDHRVIEIGANAGLHAVEIVKHAKYYIGIEPDKDYAEQFRMTRAAMPEEVQQKMMFLRGTVLDYHPSDEAIELVPTAVVVCVALYLLPRAQLNHFESKILRHCDTIIIQERKAGRDKPGNKTNGLHTPKAIRKWLKSMGFQSWVYWHESGKFFEVVGRRG